MQRKEIKVLGTTWWLSGIEPDTSYEHWTRDGGCRYFPSPLIRRPDGQWSCRAVSEAWHPTPEQALPEEAWVGRLEAEVRSIERDLDRWGQDLTYQLRRGQELKGSVRRYLEVLGSLNG
jgi:hypothetical protein